MTAPRIELHPGAREDYLDALTWYLDRSVIVAQRFQEELAKTLDQIAANPQLGVPLSHGIRWALLKRFPHVVYYREKEAEMIEVLAVAHGRRRPGYWKNRLG